MTQPDKTKVFPDKLLTDEVNKQLNITTNSPVTLLNQCVPSVQPEPMVHPDIE